MKGAKPTPYTDPVTGDALTAGEKFSWVMQSMIRRWAFIGIITVVTIVVWSLNIAVGLTWWNLGASYLALLIESTVGIAMFSQTRRDAVIIREIRTGLRSELVADLKRDAILDALGSAATDRGSADQKRDELVAKVESMEEDHGTMLAELHTLIHEVHDALCKKEGPGGT